MQCRDRSRGGRGGGYTRGSGGRSARRSRSRSRSRSRGPAAAAADRDGRGGSGGSGSRFASGGRRPDSERRDRDRDRDREYERDRDSREYRDSDRRDYDCRDRASRRDSGRERYSDRSDRGDRDRDRERDRDRPDRYSTGSRGGGSTRDAAAAAAAAPKPPSRAVLLAAAAAAPPLPPRPDNTIGAGAACRSVSGRCINVVDAALAAECIAKLCFVTRIEDDVRFESREERLITCRSVSGRCINMVAALAAECIAKLCFVTRIEDDVRFESREERLITCRSVSGRCINVVAALAAECIAKLCFVTRIEDDVRFESREERLITCRSVSGRCINVVDAALAAECIAKLCFVTGIEDDVRFESRKEREKALLFLWDRQRLELHGVFRPDAAAKALPEASLPGGGADGRSQLRVQPIYHFPVTLSEAEVDPLLIVQKDFRGRSTRTYKVQNYLAGPGQLLADAMQPLSHFRKEWWLSCKTHHPGWRYVLWDAAACEALLTQRYSWFLPTWQALGNSTVLKSDAIRPFILHAAGGVYLDLDNSDVVGGGSSSSMEPWLAGAQLVLQAEEGHTVNNAQMASVPGHELWLRFGRAIQARVAAAAAGRDMWPLKTTGPHLLTDIVREVTGNSKGDLPGLYTLPGSSSSSSSRLVVYGPRQWFTPCAWNDWGCSVRVARDKPLLRATGKHAAAAAAAANATHVEANASLPVVEAVQTPLMLAVTAVAGVHHFSGSWLGLDGSKSLSLRREVRQSA
ncbi:hypothetical protein OEZ85_001787 [Tetradesmus obliquus]|uniref:Uncharacterized protein n=1 Tax=Tetradesmus obliquus TaxID=3088 RepID=A0ABY8U5Z9_TETOB|nr:hypothetical protein OEZ85_001787 [Tetradesmus obliquus]